MNLRKIKAFNKINILILLIFGCDNTNVITNKSIQSKDTFIKINKRKLINVINYDSFNYDSFNIIIDEIFKSKSIKNRSDLKCIFGPLKKDDMILLKVGVNTESRFVTLYNFYINVKNKEIWYINFYDSLVLFNKDINLDNIR